MSSAISLTVLVVSIQTWMTPVPAHSSGWLVYYGPRYLVKANAEYRGYDLSPYWKECGVAVMSPADLGKTVWFRRHPGQRWVGPCLAVDVSKRSEFYWNVLEQGKVAEVSTEVRKALGFEKGIKAEMYVGSCPPRISEPRRYLPSVTLDKPPMGPNPLFWPYPKQELPQRCDKGLGDRFPFPE